MTWDIGEYVGAVLCGREDSLEKGDDSGFLSFTLTRAKSGNVHTRWGTYKKHKTQKVFDIRSKINNIVLPLHPLIFRKM